MMVLQLASMPPKPFNQVLTAEFGVPYTLK